MGRRWTKLLASTFVLASVAGWAGVAAADPPPTLNLTLNAYESGAGLYIQSGPIEATATLSSALSPTSYIAYFFYPDTGTPNCSASPLYQEGVALSNGQTQQSVDISNIATGVAPGNVIPVGNYWVDAEAYDRTSAAFVATSSCLYIEVREQDITLSLTAPSYVTGNPITAMATDLDPTPPGTGSYFAYQVFDGPGCSGSQIGVFGDSPSFPSDTTDLNIVVQGVPGSYSANSFYFNTTYHQPLYAPGDFQYGSNCVNFTVTPAAVLPEAPVGALLPVTAFVLFAGGVVVVRRRRSRPAV